jgi:hypothetical protein
MWNGSMDEELARYQKRLKELEIQNESLTDQLDTFFEKIGITSEELYQFSTNKENFSEREWRLLEEAREHQKIQMERGLSNIRKNDKTEASLQERGRVQANWLFVR